MYMKTDFTVHLTTEFGIGLDKRKATTGIDAEDTFLNCWRSLPKRQNKSWFSIEFSFEGEHFEVSRDLLHETNFNFWESVEVSI